MSTSKKQFIVIALVLLTAIVVVLLVICECCKPCKPTATPSRTWIVTPDETSTPISPTITPTPDMYPSVRPAVPDDKVYPDFSALCPKVPQYINELDIDSDNEDRVYIQGQVLIRGDKDEISNILNELQQVKDYEPHGPSPEIPLDNNGIIIGRYRIKEGLELEFVRRFNKWVKNYLESDANIPDDYQAPVADPNYVIREPGGGPGTTADPGESSIIGDPATLPSSINTTAEHFINQWAFKWEFEEPDNSIKLDHIFDYGPREYKTNTERGQGVKILVFDSSPLETGLYKVSLGPNYLPYHLCVSALISDTSDITFPSAAREGNSHGLFVANLAHTVAPDSFIHLIQVLQYDEVLKDGKVADQIIRGDLFSLLNALYLYLKYDETDMSTVVNLSLGFDIDEDKLEGVDTNYCEESTDESGIVFTDTVSPSIELKCTIDTVRDVLIATGDPDLLDIEENYGTSSSAYIPAVSLQALLSQYSAKPEPDAAFSSAARNKGGLSQIADEHKEKVVFVAAAGNDKGDIPQTPAVYPWVIGVAASNQGGSAACFSNHGDVGAPGGDGVSGYLDTGEQECTVDLNSCAGNHNCPYGVMSVIMTADRASYAYWAGTSFSTPLVSGMAALALGDGRAPRDVQNSIYGRPLPSNLSEFRFGRPTLPDIIP